MGLEQGGESRKKDLIAQVEKSRVYRDAERRRLIYEFGDLLGDLPDDFLGASVSVVA